MYTDNSDKKISRINRMAAQDGAFGGLARQTTNAVVAVTHTFTLPATRLRSAVLR
jgi:hypothetical protein